MRRSEHRWAWLTRRSRYYYYRLMRLQGSPECIARGLACGAFAGWFPLFGLQTIIGLILATIFRGNRIAAIAATWVSNPFTYVPIYAFNFQIGQWLLPTKAVDISQINWTSTADLLTFGGQFVWTLGVGCAVVGAIAAAIIYFASYRLIHRLRVERLRRRQLRRQSRGNELSVSPSQ